jgi:hypothetical protein
MDVNEYLLENPKSLELLFTKLFGNYMLRYYDSSNYAVEFSTHESTSYNNATKKIIVIALDNVISMIKKKVNVLAVAYHELAHTLYTDNNQRDDIRKKALKEISQTLSIGYAESYMEEHVHMIWNILEDYMIEERLMNDFPFLKPIVDPLKLIIQDDDLLLSWRKGNKISENLKELADSYVSSKKQSNIKRGNTIAKIYLQYYHIKAQDNTQPKPEFIQEIDEIKKDATEKYLRDKLDSYEKEKQQLLGDLADLKMDIEDLEEQLELEETSGDISKTVFDLKDKKDKVSDYESSIRNVKQAIQSLSEDYANRIGKKFESKPKEQKTNSQVLIDIKNLQSKNETDNALKDILVKEQETIIENMQLADYNNSVQYIQLSNKNEGIPLRKIKKVYSPKQRIRQGEAEALTKRYSTNISPKISVQKILQSKSSHVPPNVFQNKGKDTTFVKKVVIFEDVSGSTRRFTEQFSSVANSLANAFESVEWYGYSDFLWEKPKSLYDYTTLHTGEHYKVSSADGTQAFRLLNVMKKYKNKDYTYVIITDGDMKSVFRDKETWSYFKGKTCVIGYLNEDIIANSKYHYQFDTTDRNNISKSVMSVVSMIQNRIK